MPTDTTLLIRPFEPADLEAVADLIVGIRRGEFGLDTTRDGLTDLQAVPSLYQQGAGGFWIACSAGRIVGTLALLDFGGRACALRKMYVDPAHRGQKTGVALRLMETARTHAAAHGVEALYLGTLESFKAAQRFYEKHGWVALPKAALPKGFPAMPLDTRFYRLDLVAPLFRSSG